MGFISNAEIIALVVATNPSKKVSEKIEFLIPEPE